MKHIWLIMILFKGKVKTTNLGAVRFVPFTRNEKY